MSMRTQDCSIKNLLQDYQQQPQHDISEDNDDDTDSIGSQDMNEEEEYIAGDEETELILPALDINKRQDDRTRSGGITSHDQPLMDLLTSHAEGRRLLRLFRDQGVLSNNGRGKLCNLIIRTFLGDDPYNANVSGKQLLEVAHQIKTIFPKENVSTYFVPYKRNKKSKIGRASGKLHSCLSNQKKKYRKAKKKAEKEIVDVGEGTSSSMFTTAETDELLENVLMQHNANESAETMEPNFQEQSILKILLATPEGRSLLKFNKNKSVLDNTERRKLCHLVVTDLLGDDPSNVRISSQNLLNLACQIKEIFPKENVSTYFIPYTNKRNPKGKLYDCLSNRKKQYNREFKKAENTIEYNKGVSTSNFPTKAKKVVISKEILWLIDFSGPWELVEKKWKKSLEYRLSQLKDSLGVAQYMIQYPALKMPTGYQLLIQDFESLYPGYKDKLCENFPLYKGKIIEIALGKLKRTQDSTIRSLLEDYEKQSQREGSNASQDLISESTSISAFLLLASLVGRITIKTKESCLRPSKQESRERFIKYVATEKDLNEAITAKTDKESQIGSSSQPSIFIVGPSITAIEQYFVVIDGTLYEVHSILQAVDVCFKMYTSLNCKYPIKCENVWNFIQKGFYNIINPWDKEFVAVNELLADLGIDS